MRNTKKVIAATAAVATLVGLAACGSGSGDNADNSANKGDAENANITVWGWARAIPRSSLSMLSRRPIPGSRSSSTTPAPPRRPPPRSPTPSPQATAPLTS